MENKKLNNDLIIINPFYFKIEFNKIVYKRVIDNIDIRCDEK